MAAQTDRINRISLALLRRAVRVLYTVNTSPQYILAKSTEKIAVIPISESPSSSSAPRHGRTSVKACAMAICRSRYVNTVVS